MSEESGRAVGASKDVTQALIMSRLLVLQSKRLLVNSVQRRLEAAPSGSEQSGRLSRLRMEAQHAQHAYQTAVLRLGSPESDDYWVVAYSRLISAGGSLVRRLREAAAQLPLEQQGEASAEADALQEIVDRWTECKRKSMAASVA